MSVAQYGDFVTFLLDDGERLFRYQVYKRIFTPYEVEKKYIDQGEFEDANYRFGFIKESIDLGNGDFLLGIQEVFDEWPEGDVILEYYRLSELRLGYYPNDVDGIF